jgi:hypothetical protein
MAQILRPPQDVTNRVGADFGLTIGGIMNFQIRHDPRPALAVDVLGSAIALAIVWGAVAMLFGEPLPLRTSDQVAPVEMSASFDIYDSVMTQDEDWEMLASR